jgi:hypothetical protein
MENFCWTQINNNLLKLVRKIWKTVKKSRNHLVKKWFWLKDFNKALIISNRLIINNNRIDNFLEVVQDIQVWWETIVNQHYQEDLVISREIARPQIPITNVQININLPYTYSQKKYEWNELWYSAFRCITITRILTTSYKLLKFSLNHKWKFWKNP